MRRFARSTGLPIRERAKGSSTGHFGARGTDVQFAHVFLLWDVMDRSQGGSDGPLHAQTVARWSTVRSLRPLARFQPGSLTKLPTGKELKNLRQPPISPLRLRISGKISRLVPGHHTRRRP